MNDADAATALHCNTKQARARLAALGYTKVCGRCGGTGRYSYNQMDGDRCYGCSGAGKVLMPITRKMLNEAVERIARGDLAGYFAKIEARAAARKAIAPMMTEIEALMAPIGDAYMMESRAWQASFDGERYGYELFATVAGLAQRMANAIRYGETVNGRRPVTPGAMSAGDLRSAVDYDEIDVVTAAREMAERVEMMRTLRAAFDARYEMKEAS